MINEPKSILVRFLRRLDKNTEAIALLHTLLGVAVLIVFGMWWVLALDEVPHYIQCCGEGGERYSSPSPIMILASIFLFPLFVIAGVVVGLANGALVQTLVMLVIVSAWIVLFVFREP